MNDKLLDIEELRVSFHFPEGIARAVDGVSFDLAAGETLGLVGESGCGKSVTALSILSLIPSPPGRIESGRIQFENQDLRGLDTEKLRRIRGRDISMIFQEPMTSLNPVLSIGRQVAEPLMVHKALSRSDALAEAAAWLDHVKIPAARNRLGDYPHQLSGGMRVCRPKLLIADEPTTALDVTIQAQILSLMLELKSELNMSLLLITHDLMYAGQIVEEGGVTDIFDRSFHPYSRGLLKSMPRLGNRRGGQAPRLHEIPGSVHSLTEAVIGCKFADRCPYAFDICKQQQPELFQIRDGQRARCWLKHYPDRRKQGG